MHTIKDDLTYLTMLDECRVKLEHLAEKPVKPDLGMYLRLFSKIMEVGRLYRIDLTSYDKWWNEYRKPLVDRINHM